MQLTEHFTLEEMTYSDTARKYNLKNNPTQEVIDRLKNVCLYVLEPLREALGRPIHINSGYRSPEVNKRVGGAVNPDGTPKSQHCFGFAVDITVKGITPKQICNKIDELVKAGKIKGYDQLIEEFGSTGWCHVSFVMNNNRMMRFKIGC